MLNFISGGSVGVSLTISAWIVGGIKGYCTDWQPSVSYSINTQLCELDLGTRVYA